MGAAGILVCPACGCGGTIDYPNFACGCLPGVPGGITACDGYQQAWPPKGTIYVEPKTTSFQVEVRLPGYTSGAIPSSYTPTGGGSSITINSEPTLAGWKADLGSTFTLDYSVAYDVGDVSIDIATACACYTEYHGVYREIVDDDGNSYVFDTCTDAGLPTPSIGVTVSGVNRNANLTNVTSGTATPGGPYTLTSEDYKTVELAQSRDLNFDAFAQLTSNGTVSSGGLLRVRSTATSTRLKITSLRTYVGGGALDGVEHTYVYAPADGFGGDNFLTYVANGGTDTASARAAADANQAVCTGSITGLPTRTLATDGLPFRALGYVWRNVTRHVGGGDTSGHLYDVTGASLTAATPSNPGCVSCGRWIKVKIVDTSYATGRPGVDTPVVRTYHRILKQVCFGRAGVPTDGWPYACTWSEYRRLSDDYAPGGSGLGMSLQRTGPTEWLVIYAGGGGLVEGPGTPIKWSDDCPIGMTDIMQNYGYVVLPNATVGRDTTAGKVALGLYTSRTIEVVTADAEACHGCACDEACDPCQHCLGSPETIGVYVKCVYYVPGVYTPPTYDGEGNELTPESETEGYYVTAFDATVAFYRQSAEPCLYQTIEGMSDFGFSGGITQDADPDATDPEDPPVYKIQMTNGTATIIAYAPCGSFDITALTWEVASVVIDDGEHECETFQFEVG